MPLPHTSSPFIPPLTPLLSPHISPLFHSPTSPLTPRAPPPRSSHHALHTTSRGEYFYHPKQKRIMRSDADGKLKPMFVQFVLQTLWHVYNSVIVAPDEVGNAHYEPVGGPLLIPALVPALRRRCAQKSSRRSIWTFPRVNSTTLTLQCSFGRSWVCGCRSGGTCCGRRCSTFRAPRRRRQYASQSYVQS